MTRAGEGPSSPSPSGSTAMAYDFRVEILRDGTRLSAVGVTLAPCFEDVRFRAVLEGRLPNDGTVPELATEPVWDEDGPPAVAGVRVCGADHGESTYGREVFATRARAAIVELLRRHEISRDDTLAWRVVATPRTTGPRFRTRPSRRPYPFRAGTVPDARRGTLRIVVEEELVRKIRAAVVASPGVECAGLLTGQLVHDRECEAAALVVNDHFALPPGPGGASGVHWSFGSVTFAAARRSLEASGAECVGWFHSHPPCERCHENPACRADLVFLSRDDVEVHTAVFPAAYMVALVAGKVAERPACDPGMRLFAWSGGGLTDVALTPDRGTA